MKATLARRLVILTDELAPGAAFSAEGARLELNGLLLAVGAAGLSFGRFLPGASFFASAVSVLRYPEKWWLLVTFALAAAAAVGVDAVFMGDAEARVKARRILLKTAMAMARPAPRRSAGAPA